MSCKLNLLFFCMIVLNQSAYSQFNLEQLLGNNENVKLAFSHLLNALPPATISPKDSESTTTAAPIEDVEPACGRVKIKHKQLITEAEPTQHGEWPWHSAIFRLKTAGGKQEYICGGTLVSTTRVLTAGHCVVERGIKVVPEKLYVILGKYNRVGGDIGSQESAVFSIELHPEFNQVRLANDIAVLKLSSQLTYTEYVQPVCMWGPAETKADIVNRRGTVIGWGFTSLDRLAPSLNKATLLVVNDIQCIRSDPNFYSRYLYDATFCAGNNNGTAPCNGDSGGGMFFPEPGPANLDTWYLRGIVSLTVARKDKNICDPSAYTLFTDTSQYDGFINQHL